MGSIQNLLFDCHGAIKDISKLTEVNFKENSDGTLSWSEWQEILKDNNITDSFYINNEAKSKLVNYLFYVDFNNGVYIPLLLPVISKSLIDFQFLGDASYSIIQSIKIGTAQQQKHIKEENWVYFYLAIPENFYLLDFNKRAKDISDNKLLEVFKSIYSKIDYNCNYIDRNILLRLKKINSNKHTQSKIITIYRGQGEFSPKLNKVYSWTTSKNIAVKFALMRQTPECVYKAKVKSENIITKINDRYEKELIILPEDVFDIEVMEFYPTSVETVREVALQYSDIYTKYKNIFNQLIELGFSASNQSSHTLSHSARVLFYSIMTAEDLNLNEQEQRILAYCSVYHDIGRDNDGRDYIHGENSVELIKKLNLPSLGLLEDETKIANINIKYHSINDEDSLKAINKLSIKNKKQLIKLYKIFKDLDALDRVRFKGIDLDIKYFRTKEVKNYLLIACGLAYHQIEGLLLN